MHRFRLAALPMLILLTMLPPGTRVGASQAPATGLFRVVATLGYNGCLEPCALVIRNQAAWQAFWRKNGYGATPQIAFGREQVLVVGRGPVQITGYRVRVTRAVAGGGRLQVSVRESLPPPAGQVRQIEWPTEVVSVQAGLDIDLLISQESDSCPEFLWHVCGSAGENPVAPAALCAMPSRPDGYTTACYSPAAWASAPPALAMQPVDPSAAVVGQTRLKLSRVIVIQHTSAGSYDPPVDAVTFLYGTGKKTASVTEYPQQTIVGHAFLERFRVMSAAVDVLTPWFDFRLLNACGLTSAAAAPGGWRDAQKLGRALQAAAARHCS